MSADSKLVTIGRITGTHGIRGLVKVHLYSGDDTTLRTVGQILLSLPDGSRHLVTPTGIQGHGRKTLLSLAGYDGINEVLPLVGGDLLVRRNQLPKPDEGEYYWADLIGLRVSTEAGDDLGTLREIIETGSNDVYVVKGACREFLIPATDDVVRGIDLDAGTMTVSPLEGMLDL